MGTKWWILAAVCGIGLFGIVFGYPLTHSPRYETLEPYLDRFRSLPDFQELAAQEGLPYQVLVEEPDQVVVTFPLDGSKTGRSLLVMFNPHTGSMRGARLKDSRFGDKVWRGCKPV